MSSLSLDIADRHQAPHRSLMDMIHETQHHLEHLEISCHQLLAPDVSCTTQTDPKADLKLLHLQVSHLQTQLLAAITRREKEDVVIQQATRFATAKGSANGVLHALFDQASAGKIAVLKAFVESGSIPTRDGLRHWKLDLRTIRNETGSSLLHVAVGVSTARQNVKVKLVHFLVDQVRFDPNVQDLFGQTPLHVAAMGGYAQVVEALLERGADPIAQDRSGLTALSLVRTLSRPPEEVVQILVDAESSAIWKSSSRSKLIPLAKALASALFLRKLSSFTLSQHSSAFLRQTIALINTLLKETQGDNVAFDQVLQERVPMFFDVMSTCHVVPLDTIFTHSLFSDSTFVDDLKLEADGYGLSLVSPTVKFATLAGPSWMSVLLKLIQCFKVEISEPNDLPEDAPIPQDGHGYNKHLLQQKLSISSSSTSCSVGSRSTVCSANPTTFIATAREAWYYAVLFKAATYSLPGEIAVTPQCDVAIASVDVSKFFPLEDRLLIGSDEYFAIDYSSQTREIQLDRQYNGNEATVVKAYATGACSSRLPPYIALKRIWEREPGNKYEDQMSSEQELFQDYQFLDPDSECEVAIKLGPIVNGNEAKEIVAEWKHAAKELFNARECKSGLACCKHYCPQRSGHFLCLETLAVIGQGLAKRHLGRPTFSKPLKPRALLQRLQDRFKGTEEWPGSRSSVNPPP